MFAIVVVRGQTMVVSWWLGQRCWVGKVVGGQICARGGRLSSLCGRGAGVVYGANELAADGYARVRRGGGRADPVLVEVGMGSLCGGADERWSFAWGELVGRLMVFFSVWCG